MKAGRNIVLAIQRMVCLPLMLLGMAAGVVRASDESELLVAKGQVAYHTGRYDQALAHLEDAIAADPDDAEAHYVLGLVLSELKRWDEAATAFGRAVELRPDDEAARRGGEAARARQAGIPPPITAAEEKLAPIDEVTRVRRPELFRPWELHASAGMKYDSNVTLASKHRDDGAGFVTIGGRYDLLNWDNVLLRGEYDLYTDWHTDITDFDFQAHRLRGTTSYALRSNLWAGVQGGVNVFRLGNEGYLMEPFALPFVSLLEGTWGLTQVTYRHGEGTYFSVPFEHVRDGMTDAVGVTQTFYWSGGKYLTLGWAYGQENPSARFIRGSVTQSGASTCRRSSSSEPTTPCPRDFEFFYNEVSLAAGFPVWWKTVIDLMYVYRYAAYHEPNSVAGFRNRRYDNEHHVFVGLLRPVTDHVRVAISYFATINPSNIWLYDYRRNVVSGALEVLY